MVAGLWLPWNEGNDALPEQLELSHLVVERPDEDPARARPHQRGEPLRAHLGGPDG